MVKADTNYDKRVFVIIGGGETCLGVFSEIYKWIVLLRIKIDRFNS